MIESISGERFFHSALFDSLTISVWHIQMTVTHHHTHLHWFTSHSYFYKYSHAHNHTELMSTLKVKSGLLCNIKGFFIYIIKTIYTYSQFCIFTAVTADLTSIDFLHFADQCKCHVVNFVLGRNTCSVFFSCTGNTGSSWVMLPDGRPHVCWLKGNGRGMPAMPRQPGEATAEHIMPAWMWGPWHQV